MTYPRELWENTQFHGEEYPFYCFRNRAAPVRAGQQVLWMHWHVHFELIVMLKGEAVFHIESRPYDTKPGDILLVPSGGLHVGYAATDEPIEFFALVFNGSMLESSAHDRLHARLLAPYATGQARFPVHIAKRGEAGGPIRECVERAIEEFEGRQRGYELTIKSYLILLFAYLARQHPSPLAADDSAAAPVRGTERFKPLLRYVEEHYDERISVEDAARQVNLNPYHFCKLFKKMTGRTFVDYVNRHRMNEAERLLRDTDLSITEIAERVGCGNSNYFTKLFKRHMGTTPSQARGR
ncbi:helix-turn-helix transcriptional regulator [Cohnella fermenti]|uniref:Helix-turn-helix domain-containing protein n=1 Tax=Cohnella fermenti TaxID=2565925 RepID=A0A4S4BLX4_9BACL|nr:AraC family transcriptional regulator [Cohnella fermenti]THF74845.1 helix-turn-helix domain-containing protein [Cohnella fermenti]